MSIAARRGNLLLWVWLSSAACGGGSEAPAEGMDAGHGQSCDETCEPADGGSGETEDAARDGAFLDGDVGPGSPDGEDGGRRSDAGATDCPTACLADAGGVRDAAMAADADAGDAGDADADAGDAGADADASDAQLACQDADDTLCDGLCVDLQTSHAHCGACGVQAEGDHLCVDGQLECPDERTSCDGECREPFEACGSCDNDCGEVIAAVESRTGETGVGVLSPGRACVEARCYFAAIRFGETPRTCAQICGDVDMQCTQLQDRTGIVGIASYNGVLRNLPGCDTRPSSSAPIPNDPNDPPAAYLLSNVRCGCQQGP